MAHRFAVGLMSHGEVVGRTEERRRRDETRHSVLSFPRKREPKFAISQFRPASAGLFCFLKISKHAQMRDYYGQAGKMYPPPVR